MRWHYDSLNRVDRKTYIDGTFDYKQLYRWLQKLRSNGWAAWVRGDDYDERGFDAQIMRFTRVAQTKTTSGRWRVIKDEKMVYADMTAKTQETQFIAGNPSVRAAYLLS